MHTRANIDGAEPIGRLRLGARRSPSAGFSVREAEAAGFHFAFEFHLGLLNVMEVAQLI
jgi:hypothetical protein